MASEPKRKTKRNHKEKREGFQVWGTGLSILAIGWTIGWSARVLYTHIYGNADAIAMLQKEKLGLEEKLQNRDAALVAIRTALQKKDSEIATLRNRPPAGADGPTAQDWIKTNDYFAPFLCEAIKTETNLNKFLSDGGHSLNDCVNELTVIRNGARDRAMLFVSSMHGAGLLRIVQHENIKCYSLTGFPTLGIRADTGETVSLPKT